MLHTDHDFSKVFGIVLPYSKVTESAGNRRVAKALTNSALNTKSPVSSQAKMGLFIIS